MSTARLMVTRTNGRICPGSIVESFWKNTLATAPLMRMSGASSTPHAIWNCPREATE